MRGLVLALATSLSLPMLTAQTDSKKGKKEEANRNVMLNAASANGPREIQIGLPSADVNVLENGLPVTFATNPHGVNSIWRSDASLSRVGLLKISETAITTGNIGYAVNSFTQLGQEGMNGRLHYKTNHYGLHEVSANLNGGLGSGWYYSGSLYLDFDPGTFKLESTPYQDRTQIYKLALTKRYGAGRGELTAMYHRSNSRPIYTYATQSAPFIYVGDGSVRQFGGFKLGTTSYLPTDQSIAYRDMRTGELKETLFEDMIENHGDAFILMNNYRWDSGLSLRTLAKYAHSRGAFVYQTPITITSGVPAGTYQYRSAEGLLESHAGGYIQSRMACLNSGTMDELILTSELTKELDRSTIRIGLNEWLYSVDYTSSTTMYTHSIPTDGSYPVRLAQGGTFFYDYNKNASEYYKGTENKLAIYATHDWDVTDKLNLYYGARLEYQTIKGENAAVRNASGDYVGRFADYHLGATAPDGTLIKPNALDYGWINYSLTAAATYKLSERFGFTGDFTYITQRPRFENFSPATLPNTGQISVPLGRAGIYYNNDWLSLTSLVSYISKTNNNSTLNLINPNNSAEIKAAPLTYNIRTLGWTTDIVAKPLKGLELHLLFTYQDPKYSKYETSVTFSDGHVGQINATGNTVAEIPNVIIEIDPAYHITRDLRLWMSFRYFSRTFANINEAYYFNGRWETFGGVDWQANERLKLGLSVVNFLGQTGAKGSIAGAELVSKDQAARYAGTLMAGSYIRPFTVELSASLTL